MFIVPSRAIPAGRESVADLFGRRLLLRLRRIAMTLSPSFHTVSKLSGMTFVQHPFKRGLQIDNYQTRNLRAGKMSTLMFYPDFPIQIASAALDYSCHSCGNCSIFFVVDRKLKKILDINNAYCLKYIEPVRDSSYL
jgi:hypothetical protein